MSSKLPTIYTLFSVDNDFNQPGHNLIGWWMNKPSLETIAKALGLQFPSVNDEETVAVVKIWSGQTEIRIRETDYRLCQIPEGTKLDIVEKTGAKK
ncbi:hypothetical protein PP935_gp224 [Rhizobium phage RHph_N34]|uniref:Uncharacterized protein n=1 Tax=Rhizobium phage RHph_N34 TaxID=2509586 RepID=A0A7S5RJ35_9CAUD|nr:hypothetical protein PP935_gp224 [Rhizobium phage RHph_N34]QIG73999.1 hypothetical protein EVC06_224 [Rhizobium phage RHph_N34]